MPAEDAWIKASEPPVTAVLWLPDGTVVVLGLLSDGWNGWGVDFT